MTDTLPPLRIFDGGMGRLLEKLGAPFRLPEWSALSLIEAPHFVRQAHDAYIAAGADLITTNSYGLVPHMLGEERFSNDGLRLTRLAGEIARAAADASERPVEVAGSIPPLFESYRPQLYRGDEAPRILNSLIEGLRPFVDSWLIETQSSTLEALTALEAVKGDGKPVYVSYTIKDEKGRTAAPELRSGEPVADAVLKTFEAGAAAVLFNCSQPEVMGPAVRAARAALAGTIHADKPLGVYANAFEPEPPSDSPYEAISEIRNDLDPVHYANLSADWIADGATIIGGCCGIGPDHIGELCARRLRLSYRR
ncbi:homocysteine S-methyltransferase family protein [Allorhizobium sp. BGMRC 0089]|uniref:homocysteine S-methyltransferase family protein n=1 Tax=Allorhizobium sonneratiae TaxID=2934936 RepID=UPI002033FB1D|nr:homocysteine S-methyltransferase family protein [Allorhizobium sonneratiae]MCM2290858.1 homocysteine S-methyltransferase family protein [Allorhizobium sonneratiae]